MAVIQECNYYRLGNSLFQFRFHCRRDFERAIEGGPWTFKNSVLLWAPLNPKVPVVSMSLFLMDIRVRVFNLPAAFQSDKMCRHIGKFLGGFVYVMSVASLGKSRKEFIRLRVSGMSGFRHSTFIVVASATRIEAATC